MSNSNIGEIKWYGERGLINAIVTYIFLDSEDPAEKINELIKSIKWNSSTNKFSDMEITNPKILVEIGLGEFGSPDLILIFESIDKENKYCIFIEAKTDTYRNSMKPNDEGMEQGGYNSSVNGQLSLKYRFVKALFNYENIISEQKEIFNIYDNKLHENRKGARKLKDKKIVGEIRKLFNGINENNFYFVALTWDNDDFNFLNSNQQEYYLPKFLNGEGKDENDTNELKRLGHLNYLSIERSMSDLLNYEPYCNIRNLLFRESAPTLADYNRFPDRERYKCNLNHHFHLFKYFEFFDKITSKECNRNLRVLTTHTSIGVPYEENPKGKYNTLFRILTCNSYYPTSGEKDDATQFIIELTSDN